MRGRQTLKDTQTILRYASIQTTGSAYVPPIEHAVKSRALGIVMVHWQKGKFVVTITTPFSARPAITCGQGPAGPEHR
jgi:hypothetical protein